MLFAHVSVLGVAWLRIAARRGRLRALAPPLAVWLRVITVPSAGSCWLGAVLAAMNPLFYLAIDRLPLSTVGAIEFLGTVVLAAAGARTRRNLLALPWPSAGSSR